MDDVKRTSGKSIGVYTREALLEKLARDRRKVRQFPGTEGTE